MPHASLLIIGKNICLGNSANVFPLPAIAGTGAAIVSYLKESKKIVVHVLLATAFSS
jgi:hypothetical protein